MRWLGSARSNPTTRTQHNGCKNVDTHVWTYRRQRRILRGTKTYGAEVTILHPNFKRRTIIPTYTSSIG
ncbi:hypothetical protein PMIN02_009321 [Paraphaeosphaeria minitans]